jgi:hypothetical protein
MLINSIRLSSSKNLIAAFAFLPLMFFCVLISHANAQTNAAKKDNLPVWQNYKGVFIGMTATEARAKLGNPKSEDASGIYYNFSDTETAEIMLDGEKKVRAIMTMFSEEHQNPPKFESVFGKTATAEPKPDGSIYKLVRFTDAGYWVSYSRLAGEKALVIIMIQKL